MHLPISTWLLPFFKWSSVQRAGAGATDVTSTIEAVSPDSEVRLKNAYAS
jgi:hypothetical protein